MGMTTDRYATPKVSEPRCPEHPEAGVERSPVPFVGPSGPSSEVRVFCRKCGRRIVAQKEER